jgi:hypothetical protein
MSTGTRERRMVDPAKPRSYYGQPVLKRPAWRPEVPYYLFAGGLAGASAGLAFAARLSGRDRLARVAIANAFAGIAVSPPLLIADLGVPRRFLNMLRVFKVTSPMSVGSWILASEGAVVTAVAAHEFLGVLPRPLGRALEGVAALLGMPLATYTGALLANTSVPVWHEARRELPFVFAGGAAMSAGGAALLFAPAAESEPARRLALLGVALEAGSMELSKARMGKTAEPYKTGAANRFEHAAMAGAAGGAAALIAGRSLRSRLLTRLGAVSIIAGALCTRWMVFRAGFQSADDPAYTVELQRKQLD